MGIATNVLGILKLATGAARIGRGGSTVDADLTTLENGQTALDESLTEEAGKVATLQRQVVPLARAVRVVMTGISGSRGWLAKRKSENSLGTSNFTIVSNGAITSFTGGYHYLLWLYASSSNYIYLRFGSTGRFDFVVRLGGVTLINQEISTGVTIDYRREYDFALVVVRETESSDGSIKIMLDSEEIGAAVISAGVPEDWGGFGDYYFNGTDSIRQACEWREVILYNRELSELELSSLKTTGIPAEDAGRPGNRASNIAFYESDFSTSDGWESQAGGWSVTPNVDGIDGEDNWIRYSRAVDGGLNDLTTRKLLPGGYAGANTNIKLKLRNEATGGVENFRIYTTGSPNGSRGSTVVNVPVGTTKDISVTVVGLGDLRITSCWPDGSDLNCNSDSKVYIKNVVVKQVGIIGLWQSGFAQSDSGQVLDQIHSAHSVLPASGATIIPQPEGLRQIRYTLTWSGDSSAKYLVSNQDILPEGAEIERVTAVIEGTPVDGTLGDPADPDRYCTLEKNTGLIEGSNRLALDERTTDGTNRELLWTPSAAFTGTIKFTIHYFVGEQ